MGKSEIPFCPLVSLSLWRRPWPAAVEDSHRETHVTAEFSSWHALGTGLSATAADSESAERNYIKLTVEKVNLTLMMGKYFIHNGEKCRPSFNFIYLFLFGVLNIPRNKDWSNILCPAPCLLVCLYFFDLFCVIKIF